MSTLQRTNGKYLWWSLVGLGFQPEVAASSGASKANVKHIILGPNMFDKPNKDAFYIVTHFLLEKLNPARFHDAYRHCWPVLDHKADAEFRKVTCAWLRDLMDEQGSTVPKVVASLFLSPGGPKFVNLMLHLANHVMLHDMKTFSTDGTWVPEAAAAPASSVEMALKRFQLVKTRFLRGAVEQDLMLQEYQRQAQSRVKSLRDWRAEDAKYDDLHKRHKKVEQEGTPQADKIQKVRSLWSSMDGVLSTLEEERRVVESVIRGDVDQYTLDGTDLALKIPRVLLERIEQLSHLSSVGSVYEAGQLNILRMLELLHQALVLLGAERTRVAGHTPIAQLHPLHLQERNLQMARAMEDLRVMRKRISKEEIPEVKSLIRKLEAEWDRKWADCLKRTPLTSFLNEDPALDFLFPMAPLSFEPATDASFKSSIFSQYPANLPEFPEEKPVATDSVPMETVTTMDYTLKSLYPPAVEMIASLPSVAIFPLTPLTALCESPLSVPAKAPSPSHLPASVRKTPRVSAVKKKAQILDSELDNLANRFAEAVTPSPGNISLRGLELGDILDTLGEDPFSTRKQIPRTPESLSLDVKSSWRRAVEEEEAQKACLSATFDCDNIRGCLLPLSEVHDASLGHDFSSLSTSLDPTNGCSTAAPQQASLMSTLSWDSSNMEALNSLSNNNVVQFSINQEVFPEQYSIDQETLPELPGNDSSVLTSINSRDISNTEEEELLLPHIPYLLPTETEPALLDARRRLDKIQQAFGEASFMDHRQGAPEPSLSQHDKRSLDARDWLMAATLETSATVEVTDKVFSLDLDTLESPSPPRTGQYNLPQLFTFSPIDDL
ncbi:HAUS augmin-like complex subunit 6 isoform X1 [Oncorhynchus keta]|uniref:HAUS augmin-like complex subunit 6 isoform X1 n=1 Tax=Oncorhynchus keta TaxID=8018 RepID=UPI0015FAF8DD|nr:HAUS augmin-like complex subunit 6 isoform X1 [Oncorhynchus keta]